MLKRFLGSTVFSNMLYLGAIRLSNVAYIFLIPFLTRVLGLEAYGAVATVLVAIQLAFVLTDYGFSLNAVFNISTVRDNKGKVSEIIGAIFGAKLLLTPFAVFLVALAPYFFATLRGYESLFIWASIAIICQSYQPVWLFRGIEKMKLISIYMIATKIIYVVSCLVMVRTADDAVLVVACWGLSQFVALVISVYFLYKEGFWIVWPSWHIAINELESGFSFFISRIAASIYAVMGVFAAGVVSPVQAALMSVSQLIYKGGQGVTSVVSQSLYPYMARNKDWTMFWRVLILGGGAITAAAIIVSLYAEWLLAVFFGQEYVVASGVLRVYALCMVVEFFAVMLGFPAYAAITDIKRANDGLIMAAVLAMLAMLVLYLMNELSALTIVWIIFCARFFILCLRVAFLIRFFRVSRGEKNVFSK